MFWAVVVFYFFAKPVLKITPLWALFQEKEAGKVVPEGYIEGSQFTRLEHVYSGGGGWVLQESHYFARL